jgi:hypothetical protein
MYVLALSLLLATAAIAQPSAILDDLQNRALAALDSVPHPDTQGEIEVRRESFRPTLGDLVRVRGLQSVDPIKALVDFPQSVSDPAPAIVIVNPHEDPAERDAALLSASLAHLGFIVVSLDVREHHAKLDSLAFGITPESLIQHDVRAALGYLRSRRDVDGKRIGLVGVGLSGTVAAAMNPEFATIVLIDGLPDFNQKIIQMRTLPSGELPDTCDLIPGLLQHGATEELLALIVPRPMLAVNPAPKLLDYGEQVYRSFGALGKLSQYSDSAAAEPTRYAIYKWFAQWLQGRPDLGGFQEPSAANSRFETQVSQPLESQSSLRAVLSESALDKLLGAPLANPINEFQLNPGPRWERTQITQPGIVIPMTIFRPDPAGSHVLFALDDRGRSALEKDEVVQEALRHGWDVFTIDPRGIGTLKTANDAFIFAVSLLLGENFTWRQAADIRRIIDVHLPWRQRYPWHSGLYVRGKDASLVAAYVAATLGSSFPDWIALREPISSIRNVAGLPLYGAPFNGLDMFDVPDLFKRAKSKVVVIEEIGEFLRQSELW